MKDLITCKVNFSGSLFQSFKVVWTFMKLGCYYQVKNFTSIYLCVSGNFSQNCESMLAF